MKWILTGLIGLYAISRAEAISLQISKSNLGEPFYRSVSKLRLVSENSETGNVSVKFLDRNGIGLESRENIKIRKADYISCSNGFCSVEFYELPLSIEKHTCFLEVRFSSPAGQIYLNTKDSWGDCGTLPAVPDRKFLSDFVFSESAYFSESGTIEIQNIGAAFLEKPLSIWGLLRDAEGKIIWKGSYSGAVTINSQEQLTIDFQQAPNAWQNHLACSGHFFIEPEFSFFERSKLNNNVEVEYGHCEEVPSEVKGDKIDFEPLAEVAEGILSLKAINKGRLPYIEQTTRLESNIRFLNQFRQLIIMKNLFTKPKIYGFGDKKEIARDVLPDGTCFVEIELNPNLTIKESDYINNRIELKVCE